MLKCEACDSRRATRLVSDDDPSQPYLLCSPCESRLRLLALRPLEWLRLASRHGCWPYLLHDDFYDDDGKACQSRRKVVVSAALAYPDAQRHRDNLPLLLDITLSKWFLEERLVDLLRAHSPPSVLEHLKTLVDHRPNEHVESRAYEIAAEVIGPLAADWVRARWVLYRQASLPALIQASARCLPFQEAFDACRHSIEASAPSRRTDLAIFMAHFHSPATLDWIEHLVTSPVTGNWGRLATVSSFSWQRARAWLAYGRPLSLVALDALVYIAAPPSHRVEKWLVPPAANWPTDEVVSILTAHRAADSVPRVKNAVDCIIEAVRGAV